MKQVYWVNVYGYSNGQQILGLLLKDRFDCLINSLDLKVYNNISTIGRWKVTLK